MALLSRLAILSYHTSPLALPGHGEAGGMNVYVRETAAQTAAAGIEVDVFTRRSSGASTGVVEVSPGFRIVQIPAGPVQADADLVRRWLVDFRLGVDSFAQVHGLRYDGIVSHYWLSGLVGARLASRWRTPHVAAFHTLELAKQAAYSLEAADPERIRGELSVAAAADGVLASGPHERDELIGHYRASPRKVREAPPGVDHQLFRPRDWRECRRRIGLSPDRPVVLLVGRAIPLKGGEVLLRALSEMLPDRRPDAILVGGEAGADGHSRLLKRARELGVGDSVRLVGSVPQAELGFYYGAANVVAAPSHYESYGMAALEAQACGRAVVSSRVGGLPSVVEDGITGLLTPPGNSQALRQSLCRLLEDRDLAERFGRAGTKAAASRNWRKTAEVALNLVSESQLIRSHPIGADSPVQISA